MRTILISLMLVMFTRVVYGDAVIFSGNDVKALKQNLDLFGTSKLMGTATDPSSGGGLAAPLSSIAMNYVTGIGYIKTSAPNTGWSRIVDTAYAPGVYFSQGGNAFGAAGVLGTTDANRLDFVTGGVVGMSMATTGAVTMTSASSTALSVGPNGATNPAFQIDTSTASAVTGIKVTSLAAAGGSKIEAISSATNEDIILGTKGTSSSVKLQVGASNKYVATAQNHTFSVSATGTASTVRFGYTGATDTSLTASTEAPSVYFNLGQIRQHATGTMFLQRDFRITPSTHSFVGASTLSNMHGFTVDGAPIAGTNATVTNASAIYSPGNAVGSGVTNSYGLNINANTGATNNYSAIFNGGNVGIGTGFPSEKLQVASGEIMVSSNTSTSSAVHNGIKFTTDNETYYSAVRANRDTLSTRIGLSFLTANGAVPVETMRINYAGQVGIGTAAPSATLDVNGTSNVTSASTTAFTVGATGATNPALQVDASAATSVTGIKITSAAAAGGAKIETISSATNEDLALASKGTGSLKLQVNALNKYIIAPYAHTFTTSAYLGANTIRYNFTGAADTTLTASVEAPSTYFNLGQTRQHATGALAIQRDFRITPSVHSFVGASTLTNAAAFSIDGPSNGSTNATITNSHALYIPTSALTNVTNSYGLSVNATSGATNNYAAQFIGGNVGIGTSSPAYPLEVQGFAKITGANSILMDPATGIIYTAAGLANSTTLSNGKIITPATGPYIERNIADASPALIVSNTNATSTGDITQFKSNATVKARITALGSVVVGNSTSAISTSATDGFLYVSSSAGAPTGVPTTQTGSVPVHVDATNNAMYMYTNSAWRSVAGATVQGSRQTGTSMSVGTAITPALGSKTVAFVVGNGGAITITASPPITTTGMIVGQELRVCGTSNTNTVTYNNSVNLVLTGSATLGKDQCLDLMFSGTDGTNLSWIETGRSF